MINPDYADDVLERVCKDTGADGAMLIVFGGDPHYGLSAHITNSLHPSKIIQALKRVIEGLEGKLE